MTRRIIVIGGGWAGLAAAATAAKAGAEVVGMAVVVYQPNPETQDFGSLPFFYLAKLHSLFKTADDTWTGFQPGMSPVRIWV